MEIRINESAPNTSFMLRDIAFSKDFRRIQDKTQMFNTRISEHFRTRMTHTVEVSTIAEELVNGINRIFNSEHNVSNSYDCLIDLELVRSIAYAHDIGHTPFGHVGEEKINELLVDYNLFFKHNINSAKIMLDPKLITAGNTNQKRYEFFYQSYDWRLFDGVIKHTGSYPKNANQNIFNFSDPYNLERYFNKHKVLGNNEFKNFINNFVKKYKFVGDRKVNSDTFIDNYLNHNCSLSLEGQIIALADEISQRISDFDDSLRLYHKLKSNKLKKSNSRTVNALNNEEKKLYDEKTKYKNLLENLKLKLEELTKNINNITENKSDYASDKKIKCLIEEIKDENDSKKIANAIANCAKVIAKNIGDILIDDNNINECARKVSKKIHDTLVENVLIYIRYLYRRNELNTEKLELIFSKNEETIIEKRDYYLVCPIIVGEDNQDENSDIKKIKAFIDFPSIMEETFISIMKEFNYDVIKGDIINKSNTIGKNNIEELYNIYMNDMRLVDTNTKRQILSVCGKKEYKNVIKEYKKSKGDINKNHINQLILEGIARMTDIYVEKIIAYYKGYSHFLYNKKKVSTIRIDSNDY